MRSYFPGAPVIKTALDDTDWTIRKNEFGLPRYRTRDVLVLVRVPGQKWPWLILGPYEQDYAGAALTSRAARSTGTHKPASKPHNNESK